MNEQNPSDDPVKSPEIQEIIMSYRIGIIAAELAKRLDISPVRALQLFYESRTCADFTTNVQGFICMAIFILLMSLCGNVNLLFNSLIILFFRIPDLHNLIFKIFPVDFGFVSHLGAVIVNRTH